MYVRTIHTLRLSSCPRTNPLRSLTFFKKKYTRDSRTLRSTIYLNITIQQTMMRMAKKKKKKDIIPCPFRQKHVASGKGHVPSQNNTCCYTPTAGCFSKMDTQNGRASLSPANPCYTKPCGSQTADHRKICPNPHNRNPTQDASLAKMYGATINTVLTQNSA